MLLFCILVYGCNEIYRLIYSRFNKVFKRKYVTKVMAEYLPISGVVKVNPFYLNGDIGVLEGIAALGIATEYTLKRPADVEVVYDGNGQGTLLRYTSKNAKENAENVNGDENIQTELQAKGKNMRDVEEKMRSLIAFELARYFATAEMSPHAEEKVPMGKELSDLLRQTSK